MVFLEKFFIHLRFDLHLFYFILKYTSIIELFFYFTQFYYTFLLNKTFSITKIYLEYRNKELHERCFKNIKEHILIA
jgi:hypothetical protein